MEPSEGGLPGTTVSVRQVFPNSTPHTRGKKKCPLEMCPNGSALWKTCLVSTEDVLHSHKPWPPFPSLTSARQ